MNDFTADNAPSDNNIRNVNDATSCNDPLLDRSVSETIPVAILVADQSEHIVQINPAGKRLFDVSAKHPEGGRCGNVIGCVHRDDSPDGCGFGPACEECKLSRALRDGLAGIHTDCVETEVKIEKARKTACRRILVSASPFMFEGKQSVVIAANDVTERHELQSRMAQADKLSTMGMLASGVAHEINNPLCYILYNLESINKDLPSLAEGISHLRSFHEVINCLPPNTVEIWLKALNPRLWDDLLSRFEDALAGALKIREIARGLSTFSRVEKDQLFPIDVKHAIEAAINMAYNEIKYRARLVKDYGKTPLVTVSEGRLSQVFLNLILNATQAIEEGDAGNNEIRVSTRQEEGFVSASVSDTGCGIAPEILKKVFDPFFSTKKTGHGSGLGLSISKSIIESYGGRIEVQSKQGHGTTFTILIPIEPVQIKNEDKTCPATKDPGTKGRVLIVDDEKAIRSAIRRILRNHDFVEAGCGAKAQEIIEADGDFDLIISDIMMPDISGIMLHKWLKATKPELAERFIFITGGAFTPKAREYLLTNGTINIEKPFQAANLRKIANDLIRSVKKQT